jgi:hypothetical protein
MFIVRRINPTRKREEQYTLAFILIFPFPKLSFLYKYSHGLDIPKKDVTEQCEGYATIHLLQCTSDGTGTKTAIGSSKQLRLYAYTKRSHNSLRTLPN